MDTQVINELVNVLNSEAKIYDDILKISKNKTNIIVEGKVSELENIVKLEQSLVLQMSKLENERENLINKISRDIGIKPEDLTITDLVKYTGESQRNILKSQQENMLKVIKDLSDTNNLNSKLIKNSLEYINFSLNLYANTGNADNNYNVSGSTSDKSVKNFFDIKI